MQSFWQENVRHWQKTTGLWACAMLAVVTLAHQNAPTASVAVPAAHAAAGIHDSSMQTARADLHPSVSLSYTPLNLSALNTSAYGDAGL